MADDNPVDGRDKLVTLLTAYGFPLTQGGIDVIALMPPNFAGEFEEILRIRILTHQMIDLLERMAAGAENSENSVDQIEPSPNESEKHSDNVIPFNRDPAEA